MQGNRHISDEMLTRYLSGMTTSAEEAEVLDYLAENDERIDDLFVMVCAIEQCAKSNTMANHSVLSYDSARQALALRRRPFFTYIAVAASVVLLIGIGITMFRSMGTGITAGVDISPSYAVQDTITSLDREDVAL